MSQNIRLNALFLYAPQDEPFVEAFAAYFKSLQEVYFQKWDSWRVDALPEQQLTEAADEVDILIIGLSMDLVVNRIVHTSTMQRILKYHRMGRLQVVPVLLRSYSYEKEIMGKIPVLPGNGLPVESVQWSAPDQAYIAVVEGLRRICEKRLDYKQALEDNWRDARAWNTEQAYQEFLDAFKFSKYAAEARSRMRQREENRLWEEAQAAATVKGYLTYLWESPLKEKPFEAAQKIADLEETEALHWADAEKQDRLMLYYRYRIHQPGGAHENAATGKIDQHLARIRELEKIEADQLKASYLEKLALERLESTEAMAYQTYVDYFAGMKSQLERIRQERMDRLTFTGMIVAVAVIVFMMTKFLLGVELPSILPKAPWRSGFDGWDFFWWVLIGYFLAEASRIPRFFWQDQRFLEKARGTVRTLSVMGRAFFLGHDQPSFKNTLNFCRLIEEKARRIRAKSWLYYLWQDPKEQVDFLHRIPPALRWGDWQAREGERQG